MGGSRAIATLDTEVLERIRQVTRDGHMVLVGDAPGVDDAIQRLLADDRYDNVRVFVSAGQCRRNHGKWPVEEVTVPTSRRDRRFHMAKDLEMSKQADEGLMVWDGISLGTFANVVELAERRAPVTLFLAPAHEVRFIDTTADVRSLLDELPQETARTLDQRLGVRKRLGSPQLVLDLP